MMAPKYNHASAKISGVQVMASTKTQTQSMTGCGSKETGGCKSKNGGIMRVMVRAAVRNLLPPVKHFSRMMSNLNSGTGLLKGQEEAVNPAGQSSFNVNLELCNVRGLLRRLKGEVVVGLARLDTVIQVLESFGPGQDSLVQKGVGSKGKEKMGAKGKSPKPTRGFKPKRKMVFKPMVVAGSGTRAKVVKPSSPLKLLEKAHGWKALSSFLAREPSFARDSTSACLAGALLQSASGNSEWVLEELLTGLRNGCMCPSRLASMRLRVEDGVVSGGLGTSKVGGSSLISPVEGSGCMGCPRVAEVSPAMVGEEACSTPLETPLIAIQSTRIESGELGELYPPESLKNQSMQELDLVKAQGMGLNSFKCTRERRLGLPSP